MRSIVFISSRGCSLGLERLGLGLGLGLGLVRLVTLTSRGLVSVLCLERLEAYTSLETF